MCQESLINYLENKTGIDKKQIENFIHNGEISDQIRDIKKKVDILLKNIKIVDPAIGSGAFPVGMMTEIVKARSVLTKFFPKEEQSERLTYNFKRECIENSLYGVDIDPGAVDIARLRLWLSLIVDETDIHKIKPLPNLDYKIMCGNSLLDEFEGVKLFDEGLLGETKKENNLEIKNIEEVVERLYQELGKIKTGKMKDDGRSREIKQAINKLKKKKQKLMAEPKREGYNGSLFEVKKIKESQKKLKEIKALHKQFFNEHDRRKKIELRTEIEKRDWEFIEETLKEQGNEEAMKKLEQIKKTRSKPFFLWKLYFSDIFQENGGFDICIANPPYIGEKEHKEIFKSLAQTELGRKFYQGRMDLFYFFFHLAIDLGKINSQISFITTNYYLTATYAKKLRQDFRERTIIKKLINFNELKIFKSALGQHNIITILEKGQNKNSIAQTCFTRRQDIATPGILQKILYSKDTETDYFEVAQKDLYDGDELYIRIMGGVKNLNNPFHKILDKVQKQGDSLGIICNINQGIISGADKVSKSMLLKLHLKENLGDGIFVLDDSEIDKLNLNQQDAKILKPWFKNSDIKKYYTNIKTHKRVIYNNNDLKNIPPKIFEHLSKFEDYLSKRREFLNGKRPFWQLHWGREEKIFESPKIVVPQRSKSNVFGYNELPWYASADVYFITKKNNSLSLKYILSLLNSKVYYIWLYYKGKRKGEMLELYQRPLSEIPIKKIDEKEQKPFIELVDKILFITKDEDYLNNLEKQAKVKTLEKNIDQLVYELYRVTPDEIKVIEDFCDKK
jgi:adenine-specific DNA-methyltransferase